MLGKLDLKAWKALGGLESLGSTSEFGGLGERVVAQMDVSTEAIGSVTC